MVPMRVVLAALTMILVTLAGCSGGDEQPANDTPEVQGLEGLQATEDTGIIRGVVVDPAIQPLAGVTVTIKNTEKSTTTNDAGAFGFDGLEPGTYFLEASKPGFSPAQQSVDVVAGVTDPPAVKILMEPDPTTAPSVEQVKFEGFIECSTSVVVVRVACGGVPNTVSDLVCLGSGGQVCAGNVTNDRFIQYMQFSKGVQWIQSEMVWDSTQALGDEMQVSYTDPGNGTGQVRINASAGTSPQIVTVGPDLIQDFDLESGKEVWLRIFNDAVDETDQVNEQMIHDAWNSSAPQPLKDATGWQDCVKYPALFDACLGVGGVGLTIEQKVEIITNIFYYFQPDDGWTFIEDGPHPLPK